MLVGCLVLARRFALLRRWGSLAGCVATVVAVVVIDLWPDPGSLSGRLLFGSAVQSAFLALLAAHLMRGLPDAAAS